MQTFGLNYEVKPDHVDEFKTTLMNLIEEMQSIEGHVETRLFVDVARPNSMMIYSNWKTKADFASYFRSDKFQNALQKAVSMLESRPTHMAGQNIRLVKSPGPD